MTCGCEGKRGVELAVCLAPPRGDHEVYIPITRNQGLVVNDEGVFTRTIIVDDTLPFARHLERRVDPGILERLAVRITPDTLACMAARALVEAASAGSLRAKRKLEECRGLVERLLEDCG